MAVKRVVVYPYPKDIDAFESVYNNEHVSDGNRKPERKDKDCRDKGSQLAACRACLLSRGRGPFPHSRSPGGMCSFGAREADNCSCTFDLVGPIFIAEEETYVCEENPDSAASSAAR